MTTQHHESTRGTTGTTGTTGTSASSSADSGGLLDTLLVAWDRRLPDPPAPPGPRGTGWRGPLIRPCSLRGAAPGTVPVGWLLRTAWHGPGHHTLPGGRISTVRRRPTPSAGGCYPVQLHALVGEGCDLPRGRYAVDAVSGWPRRLGQAEGPPGHALVVLSILPARTAAKYHHRAWPLWVADTVYALRTLATLAAAAGTTSTVLTGSDRVTGLRRAADLPDQDTWAGRWNGTTPETVMAGLQLTREQVGDLHPHSPSRPGTGATGPSSWSSTISAPVQPDPSPAPAAASRPRPAPGEVTGIELPAEAHLGVPIGQLLRRRSPEPGEFDAARRPTVSPDTATSLLRRLHADAGDPPSGTELDALTDSEVRRVTENGDLGNDQTWLSDVPLLLRVRHTPTAGPHAARDLLAAMWWAAWVGAAASLAGNARAVGGWTRTPGRPHLTLHGVALCAVTPTSLGSDDGGGTLL